MRVIFGLVALMLAGCATHSGVVPLTADTFLISRQAATGIGGMGNLRPEVMAEARQHCEALGRSLVVISTRESEPPYVMGNYPRIDLEFRCA